MFISNNRASSHFWSKENLVKHHNTLVKSHNITKMIVDEMKTFSKTRASGLAQQGGIESSSISFVF